MPDWNPDALDNFSYASVVFDNTGNQIAQLSSVENRLHFTYEELPETLIKTIIAVEDQRFYKHKGYDTRRIIKGAFNTLLNPDKPEGGSTLTIQLAKNTFIDIDQRSSGGMKGIQRKIQEIKLARQIEKNYDKDEILHAYLNQVYLGHGTFGVRSAALVYFGKDLHELTPPEIALICGLPQAPDTYDPYQRPESAKTRRAIILQIMLQEKIITAAEYEQCKEEPFTFVNNVKAGTETVKMGVDSKTIYPYFVDYLVSCLLDENKYNLSSDQIYKGGLKIYTTVDPAVQEETEKVMKDPANFPPDAKDGVQVQGAAVILENATGNIIALTGGREYPSDEKLCFNRASEASRQPGSCAKPLMVYAPALDRGGFFTGTVLDDCPSTFGGSYTPKNASGGYSGLITMREAIRRSINIYAVKLYQAAGPEHCFNFAKNNLELQLEDAHADYLSNALGSFGTSPLEMARAYSTFPNQGLLTDVHCVTKITDINNNTILEPETHTKRAMKNSTAYIMCNLLRDVVENGTATNAQISNWYVAGKTGTTDSDQYPGSPDIWFTGFTPLYTCAVWMGFDINDNNHYLQSGTYGGDRPARLWRKIMVKALEGKPSQTTIFPRPNDVISIQYDAFSGLRPSNLTPSELIRSDIGTPEGAPAGVSDIWIVLSYEIQTPNRNWWLGPTTQTETGVYLNKPPEFWSVMSRSPDKELKYKPPDKNTVDGKPNDNNNNSNNSNNNNNNNNNNNYNSAFPQYTGSLSQNGNTVNFSATIPNNTPYRSVNVYVRNPLTQQYVYLTESSRLSEFSYDIPPLYRGMSSFTFQFVFRDGNGYQYTSPQALTVTRS
ncbi:MAG: PBP1A family penicillin-binding protein [Peptococcaceae bacterium]|nr:PBP1A family penicillin-binding protein [Peptococcaceae bacterium]